MDNNLTNMLLDSFESSIIDTVEKAGYNRTIQATIIKCIDATIGQYQCKYQDSNFYAYSEDTETTYSNNTEVYILIQNNDFNGDKRILGSVKKLGVNYIGETEEENNYDIEGVSLINSDLIKEREIGLHSYREDGETIVLYDKNNSNNIIQVDKEMTEYILSSTTSLMIDMIIRTDLDKCQQFRGNYGLKMNIAFENEADGSEVVKEYLFDVDKFSGNPYKFINDTRQYIFFPINFGKFIEIRHIEIYCKDFPNSQFQPPMDIFITDIQLFGANRMSEDELNGCSISFIIPQGSFFDENNRTVDKKVKAQVKIKGQLANDNVQDIKYYWFREDVRVTLNSEFYNSLGGRGWRCLNEHNIIQATEGTNEQPVVEWVPSGKELTIKFDDVTAKLNKFKCVVEYDEKTFYKEFTIKNMSDDSIFEVNVVSSNGETFYFDVGNTDLHCISNYGDDLEYAWAKETRDGYLEFLDETKELNEAEAVIKKQLTDLLGKIEGGILLESGQESLVNELKRELESIQRNQRVKGSTVFNVDLSKIEEQATFKCSCYTKTGSYIGTGSVTIKNITDQKPQCRVVINGGNQVFKYSEDGIAPTSSSTETPMILPALTYTIYDENDNKVPESVAERCSVMWKVSSNRSMLKPINMVPEETEEEKPDFLYYKNVRSFTYDIDNRYDFNKDLNNVDLFIDYKGNKLHTSTNFLFTKIGDPGTNGTNYVCRLRLNTTEDNPKVAVVRIDGQGFGVLNFNPTGQGSAMSYATFKKIFKVELWKNGEKVELDASKIKWRLLTNKYNSNTYDKGFYLIDSSGRIAIDYNHNAVSMSGNGVYDTPANIVECEVEYDKMKFFASAPIITVLNSTSGYDITLKDNSGYQFVTYSSDGRNPTYNDADPFEIVVKKNINGFVEDLSNVNGDQKITYEWKALASVYRKDRTGLSYVREYLTPLELSKTKDFSEDECQENQRYAIPPAECSGEGLTYCIWVTLKNKNLKIGEIHIPVHLYLNRFGISSVNDWDGNSIQLNEDGGYILAPQVGAGIKDNGNKFTGVLMGQVREANRTTEDIGLLGYNKGEKTFFLDSQDGSLILGKKSAGRIYMNPASGEGLIYSDNYWTSTSYDEAGKLLSYNRKENNKGMLINLTDPSINFGNRTTMIVGYRNGSPIQETRRNFSVSSDGTLIVNKGILGNFTFEIGSVKSLSTHKTSLHGTSSVTSGKFYTYNKDSLESNEPGFYMDSLGRMKFGGYGYGVNSDAGIFTVNQYGYMQATAGKISSFNFDDKLFYSDGKFSGGEIQDNVAGIYIDSSVGGEKAKLQLGSNFKVMADGTVTAKKGILGAFTLTDESLYSLDKSSWNSPNWDSSENTNGFYVDKVGWIRNKGFFVASSGTVVSSTAIYVGDKINPASSSSGVSVGDSAGMRMTTGGISNLRPNNLQLVNGKIEGTQGFWVTVEGNLYIGQGFSVTNTGNATLGYGHIGGLSFSNGIKPEGKTGDYLGLWGSPSISYTGDFNKNKTGFWFLPDGSATLGNSLYLDNKGTINYSGWKSGCNSNNVRWLESTNKGIYLDGVKDGIYSGRDIESFNWCLDGRKGKEAIRVYDGSYLVIGKTPISSGLTTGHLVVTGSIKAGGNKGLTGTWTDVEALRVTYGIVWGVTGTQTA